MGYIQDLLQQTGSNAAQGALGAIMGIAMEGHNDRRQLNQQSKLQALQIQGNKEMLDYQKMKDLEMWKATSYGAQKEQMLKAGLNPALMYGMSGGGGTTTGGSGSGVSGANAPSGGGEMIGMGIQMMNLQLLKAQKENIEADTANKQADIPVKQADIELKGTQIESLSQGIKNQESANTLMKIEAEIKRVDLGFNRATYDDRIEYIHQEAREMEGRASQALIQANVDEQTLQTKIKTIKAEYIQRLLENALITAKTKSEYQAINESQSRVSLNQQTITNMVQEIMIKWDTLGNDKDRIQLLKTQVGFDTDVSQSIVEKLSTGIGVILGARAGGIQSNNPIRGFHKR